VDETPRGLNRLTVVWACVAGATTLMVYPGFFLFLGVVAAGFVLGIAWCALLVQWLVKRRPFRGWRGKLRWAFCPAVGLLLVVLSATRLPLMARVAVSDGALLDLVERAEEGFADWPTLAGAMIIEGVDVQDRCVFLKTDDGVVFRMYGLVYVKDGGDPDGGYLQYPTDYRHLVGRWWTFGAVD
jgi:hypothetical protein